MGDIPPEPSETYLQLRSRVLSLNPTDVGISPSIEAPHVWGVVMETTYAVGSASLVCLADGTTSLYFSTGGGMLGSGDYLPVAEASKALVAQAETHLSQFSSSTDHELPEVGQVRFIIMTFTGEFSVTAPEEELTSGEHSLSPLFVRAQNALSQLRLSSEKRRK